jgi:hypothetical protein
MDNRFDMSCQQASELLSQAQERPLGWVERNTLLLHLMMCDGCRNFQKQLGFIRTAVHHLRDKEPPSR